jgi:lambda repressor-like predicted transcriptional regulator
MGKLNLPAAKAKELQYVNWAAVARRHRLNPTTIYNTIAGRRKNPAIRRLICDFTGLRPKTLWPKEKAS